LAGEVITFRYQNKVLLKRVKQVFEEEVELEGDNPSDSLRIGRISFKQIQGKVAGKGRRG
jgi:hypothetical protein